MMPSRHSFVTMLTTNLLIFALLVWSVCQHAADGRYVDADEFTTLVAEVATMKEERLEFNSRITELETKLSIGEAKLGAVEDKFSVTEAKLAATEENLRNVEGKLDGALSRIDELEKHAGNWRDQEEVTSNKTDDEYIGNENSGESKIITERLSRGKHWGKHAIKKRSTEAGRTMDITRRNTPMEDFSKRIAPMASQRIAFSAIQNGGQLNDFGIFHTVTYDHVELNAGNGYLAPTGVFTCPVSGVYVFQSALLSAFNSVVSTEIVKDGRPLVAIRGEGSSSGVPYGQGCNSVITTCNKGEHVWVRVRAGTAIYGGQYPTFSGYLLWEN